MNINHANKMNYFYKVRKSVFISPYIPSAVYAYPAVFFSALPE